MTTKTDNKYWEKSKKMEELTIKTFFYGYLMNNINNEELEERKKAKDFYNDNKLKTIFENPKKYFDCIKKAVELDCENKGIEYNHKTAVSYIENHSNNLSNQRQKVKNFFKLYQMYRDDLSILSKDNSFIDILLQNENIEYSDNLQLLNIAIDLIQNYLEVQAIKIIQNLLAEEFKIKYRVTWPTSPFKKAIDDYIKFLNRLGYYLDLSKSIDLPIKETEEFIKKEIRFFNTPESQINKVIENYQVSISIEEIND